MSSLVNSIRPGPFRHLIIVVYDLLLLLSSWLLATLLIVALNGGEAIGQGNPFFFGYLFLVSFAFYGWFWTHGGQTLGMRSWRVFLLSYSNGPVTWQQAFLRFAVSIIACLPLGLGIWWQYLGKDKISWPDSLSGTYLHYSKDSKNKPVSRLS
ncbi:MAG: RDD family protein [Gammaproteobacteria bacterium]|nr:RDD family protein [Gammaproteobacteria bacterium]